MVPLAEQAKVSWEKSVQGIRQFGGVSLVEAMPIPGETWRIGRSNKGDATV